eukprot:2270070-Amphidinium_carterae.3
MSQSLTCRSICEATDVSNPLRLDTLRVVYNKLRPSCPPAHPLQPANAQPRLLRRSVTRRSVALRHSSPSLPRKDGAETCSANPVTNVNECAMHTLSTVTSKGTPRTSRGWNTATAPCG